MRTSVTSEPGGPTVLTVQGEIDLAVADDLRRAGLAALATNPSQLLELELSGVTFIDSTGLGALIRLRSAADGRLVLVSPSERVTALLELTGLDGSFEIRS